MKQRIGTVFLCLCLILTVIPLPVFAAGEIAEDSGVPRDDTRGLCEHHPDHTGWCNYSAGETGSPCTHVHDEGCQAEEIQCIHTHTAGCFSGEMPGPGEGAALSPPSAIMNAARRAAASLLGWSVLMQRELTMRRVAIKKLKTARPAHAAMSARSVQNRRLIWKRESGPLLSGEAFFRACPLSRRPIFYPLRQRLPRARQAAGAMCRIGLTIISMSMLMGSFLKMGSRSMRWWETVFLISWFGTLTRRLAPTIFLILNCSEFRG